MSPHVRRRVLAVRFICRIILAPTAIGFTIYYLASRFGLAYKPLLVLCGVVICWPIKYLLEVKYEGWRRTWKARALGAVTASEPDWKPFGVLGEIQETFKNGFIGELIRLGSKQRVVEHSTLCSILGEWFATQHEKVGSGTWGGVITGDYLISTADPGNIKAILATEFNNFEKGTPSCILLGHLLTVPSIRFLRP